MNLVQYVNNGLFDWTSFENDVKIATRGLNEVLIEGVSKHPLKKQQIAASNWRAIGLGVLDLAGALVKMKLVYGSTEAILFCREVTRSMLIAAFCESCDLNKDNIAFDNLFESEFYKSRILPFIPKKYHNRYPLNSQLLTIAPTGTLSTMLNSLSGGAEPAFALSYTRTTKSLHGKDVTYEIHPPLVEKYMKEHNCSFKELPKEFITSDKLYWKDRINMQAALQTNIDASISSTLNLKEDVSLEDVKQLYIYAWKQGLKGATIFRRNCKRVAILNDSNKKIEESSKESIILDSINTISRNDLGQVLSGETYKYRTACGTLYITVNKDDQGNIVEIFTNSSKNGTCKANLNGETRLASLALRAGVKTEEVIDTLKSIQCQSCAFAKAKGNQIDGTSCPDIIAKCLKQSYNITAVPFKPIPLKSGIQLEANHSEDKCPECGKELVHSGGCVQCSCGYSKCN